MSKCQERMYESLLLQSKRRVQNSLQQFINKINTKNYSHSIVAGGFELIS